MIKELIENEKQYLNSFLNDLNSDAIEKFLDILYSCKGFVFLSGVGKSGLVAKKIAMTMTSTGTRASFLCPTGAVHGDLGLVSEQDVFVMLSKSGETDELLQLIPYLRNKGAKMLSIVCNEKSRIAHASDFSLALSPQKELCPFDMAPTTSAVMQMIIGDVLTVGLMRKKGVSLDEYSKNHPSGRIGKRITMKVKDLMISGSSVPLCNPLDKLCDILVELSSKKCGCVLVADEQKTFQGIFTDGDLRRSLQKMGKDVLDLPIKHLMTASAKWIEPDALALDALKTMEENQKSPITTLPVLNALSKKIVGLIKMHDIIQSGL